MKLILVFAFLALICMARTAPTPSSTSRVLILPDYHEENDHEDKTHTNIDNNHDDEEDEDEHPSTTTTIRSTPGFPSRNPDLIPTRRPIRTQRTSSIQTTSAFGVDDDDIETIDEYNGDYRHFQDLRKYLQQIIEEFRKMVRKIMGSDFGDTSQQNSINQYDH
ncbi:unnamed protein product [Rotaria sordida]|uniref:Uncharacterized protein n=1 Tax=Rotaria sordida TaxID=392033 RepID=A0A813ZA42_9BILA|nr:unnamed protein product [Rotaria sordida]CAF0896051.1 unnamed protein product [Rotaria sordida]CAF1002181.1 unnamed protein product [Rotaria sordida]CAF3548253.1 unnamed protein product [Rotaria sordida]